MHFIIGTAGHVDHGKTTLIRALTGIETDRLREEKERGLSIVPGFAHLTLPPIAGQPQRIVGIVDVPGHERFLKNMLSGVTGVDVAMLVIAADEGVMPQTTEHLRVLELLRLKRGVVVLTKCDAVDEEWLALARDDVRTKLKNTLLSEAPLLEVSAVSGAGLDELKAVLATLCTELDNQQSADGEKPFRLAIDRAFSISGFGTVVTGSAADGAVFIGDALDVWRPGQERALTARVRGLEVHGAAAQHAERGQRTALNLAGVDLDEAARGGTVAAPATLRAVRRIEVWLQCVPDAPRPLKDKAPIRFHLGTAELEARLSLHEGPRLNARESGFGRLQFETPLACARSDRFILREVATERVVGGGLILELADNTKLTRAQARERLPVLYRAMELGDTAAVAELLLRRAGAGGLNLAELKLELRLLAVEPLLKTLAKSGALWRSGDDETAILVHREIAAELKTHMLAALADFHGREPLQQVMNREALRTAIQRQLALRPQVPGAVFEALLTQMAAKNEIAVEPSGVRLSSHRVTLKEDEARLKEKIERLAYEAGFQPATIDELIAAAAQKPHEAEAARKLCFALLRDGTLSRAGDYAFSSRRIAEGTELLRAHFANHPTLAVSEARDLFNVTRKWLVPLLELYDRLGVTRRSGDVRVLR